MKKMIQQESVLAYKKIKHNLRNSYVTILNTLVFVGKPLSNNDLARCLRTVPNKISGRTGEMLKLNLLYVPKHKINSNGLKERLYWVNWNSDKIMGFLENV